MVMEATQAVTIMDITMVFMMDTGPEAAAKEDGTTTAIITTATGDHPDIAAEVQTDVIIVARATGDQVEISTQEMMIQKITADIVTDLLPV
jgi:hypothetical protein